MVKHAKKPKMRLIEKLDWTQALGDVYFPVARRLARANQISGDDAQTCVTTVCLDLLRRWRKSGPPPQVRDLFAYLLGSAFNASRKVPRRDERLLEFRPPVSSDPSLSALDPPGETWSPLDAMVEREKRDRSYERLEDLSDKGRDVLMLNCQGYSLAQVARMRNSGESYVRSLMHKALRKLRRLLGA
jgi:DNA-directed RNA polymerase specialized sigma24 family protein